MAGLAFPSADAPGAAPAVDRSSHLLLVPHTADGQAALARSDARVIARYGEFTLTEASGTDDERLREAGADRRDDMREVGLPDAEIDPLTQRASLAAKSAPDREEVLAVVQFVGPVKEEWLGRVRRRQALGFFSTWRRTAISSMPEAAQVERLGGAGRNRHRRSGQSLRWRRATRWTPL